MLQSERNALERAPVKLTDTVLAASATAYYPSSKGQDRLGTTLLAEYVRALVWADKAGTLTLEESDDRSTWATTGSSVTVSVNDWNEKAWTQLTKRYWRWKYVNGGTPQGAFRLYEDKTADRAAVETELPAAAALADAAANPTAPAVGSMLHEFNGSTWDRQRNNHEVTVLASAARTGDTASAELTNYNARGVALLLDVTAIGTPAGQIDALQVQAKIGSNWFTIYAFSTLAIATTGRRAFLVYPGAASAGSWTSAPLQGVIPRSWRVNADHANETDSITYTLTASYVV